MHGQTQNVSEPSFSDHYAILTLSKCEDAFERFHETCQNARFFTRVDKCRDLLTDINHQTFLLIITHNLATRFMPFIHPVPHLEKI